MTIAEHCYARSLWSGVVMLAVLVAAPACSSVPTLTFADEVTEQNGTEPDTCPSGEAPGATACCGRSWCYGDNCNCGECIAKCGDDQVCCTKKSGPPANRLTCAPLGRGC